MPARPDVWGAIDARGKKAGKRGQNTWAVDLLVKGDVYVADQFGAHRNGPTIGDNVGSAIYAKTGNGIVYDGALRDLEGLERNWRLYFLLYQLRSIVPQSGTGDLNTMIIGINQPTRIRTVTVMPGDVVLGKLGRGGFYSSTPGRKSGKDIRDSAFTRYVWSPAVKRRHLYTAGQIDAKWSDDIEKDFSKWLNDHINELPVPKEQVQEYLKERNW